MGQTIKKIFYWILSKMRDRVFVVALALSLCLFLINKLNENYTYSTTIPIVITGAISEYDDDLIADDAKVYYINVLANAKGSDFLFFSLENRVAVSPELLQFEKVGNNQDLYQINKESLRTALESIYPELDIISVQNSSVILKTISFTQKRVPLVSRINVNKTGEYMQIGQTIFNPDSVTVYGTRATLDTVKFVTTEYLYIRKPEVFLSGQVKIQRNDSYEVTPREASYLINMDSYTEIKESVEVQVNDAQQRQYTLIPEEVEVTFNVSHSAYPLFSPQSVRFYIDLKSNLDNGTHIINWSDLPNGVEVLSVEPATVSLFKNQLKR